MSKPEFIEFKTKDGLTLPGLLFAAPRAKTVLIDLHGNGSSSVFYGGTTKYNDLAAALARENISLFAFNNRGAHLVKRLTKHIGAREKRLLYGMAYEKIKECVPDIDGAVSFLRRRGYRTFYLSGLSTGANKICVYDHYKKRGNPFKGYILLSGGDDSGIYYHGLGKKNFWEYLAESKRMIARGRGAELIPKFPMKDFLFSYQGFYDIANPDGDYNTFPYYDAIHRLRLSRKPLFRYFKGLRRPSLVVYGDNDEYLWKGGHHAALMLKKVRPDIAYRVIDHADHAFTKHKKEMARIVARWISGEKTK